MNDMENQAVCQPPRHDAKTVKDAASGKWPEILSQVGGIDRDLLDGKNHPCPKCIGKDRFRMIDADAGALFCNQCFNEKNGDGISALMWLNSYKFPEALRAIAGHLGINSNGHNGNGQINGAGDKSAKFAVSLAKLKPIKEDRGPLLEMYCKAKPPVTAAGIEKCNGKVERGCGQICIRVDGYKRIGDSEPSAVVLLCVDGRPFPAIGSLAERKSHTVGGSVNSWLAAGDVRVASTIIDTEGVPDLLAAASMLPQGWAAVTNTAGAKTRGKLTRKWAKGKRIIIVGDADEPGQDGQRRAAAAYHKAGADVSLAVLPYPIEEVHGKDLRDWLTAGDRLEGLPTEPVTVEQAVEWGKKSRTTTTGGRSIVVNTDESRVIDEAIEALATQENIYRRGSGLVHVVKGSKPPKGISRPTEPPRIALAREARVRELMAASANWLAPSEDGDGLKQVHPPVWAVKGVVARESWPGIRRLEAVVETPVLRADGTVVQEAGYDAATGIIFYPNCEYPPIPERPTRDHAVSARDQLLEVVADFPFAGNSHKAGWVTGVLSPLARYAYSGPTPLFLLDANVRGCGKSLSIDATSLITTGQDIARMTLPRDDDELRKRITALAAEGNPLILLDNIGTKFGSPSLDAMLTATKWSDRILGQTSMTTLPLYSVWYATGNNIILAADTSRRVVHVRLESPEESPEERTGFRHANLLSWVRQERPRLTMAAVTILAAYCHAGRPSMKLTPWGSFEGWSDLVRQAVVWCGLPDPGANRQNLANQSDREAVALRQLIDGWAEIDQADVGVTVTDVISTLTDHPDRYAGLRSALLELAPPRDGKTLNPRSIGMKLHHLRRRVIGGKFLDRRNSRQGAKWRVYASDQCGTSGTSGTNSIPRGRGCAHAHTRNSTGTESSPATTSSPATPDPCPHDNVAEEPTFDGFVNRSCRDCGKSLACQKQEQSV